MFHTDDDGHQNEVNIYTPRMCIDIALTYFCGYEVLSMYIFRIFRLLQVRTVTREDADVKRILGRHVFKSLHFREMPLTHT